ncbi:MAG: hypothetical protein WC887_01935 [Candidatus Paceibacterota bacterium]|jgi:hypothetical protein
MSKNNFTRTLALFFIGILILPSVFLGAPQRAHAFLGIGDITFDPTNWIQNSITAVAAPISATADFATQVNDYVLQPLAFALSGNLMKQMTANIINFVNTGADQGKSQFVTDIRGSMRSAGDAQAFAFFVQLSQNSNSPFASVISSSLRANYLQNTSTNGFWAANRCTLSNSSPNINKFLAGDWSQGGASAWFALTTQDQNNPYTLYQSSQNQLNSLVSNSQAARTLELTMGQGFLSWCGSVSSNASADGVSCESNSDCKSASCIGGRCGVVSSVKGTGALYSVCFDDVDCASGVCGPGGQCAADTSVSSSRGISSGDTCTNKDGTPGVIKTPGSVIGASLNKALGLTADKLSSMGSTGKEINSIMKDSVTIMNTVQFASQLLGGVNSGGLAGFGKSTGSNSNSQPDPYEYLNSQGYLGVTESNVNEGASTDSTSLIATVSTRVADYQLAWEKIEDKANKASNSITDLENYCAAQKTLAEQELAKGSNVDFYNRFISDSTEWIYASQDIFTNDIAPVLTDVKKAKETIIAANAMVDKVKNEKSDDPSYVTDIQTLQTMSPTATEVRSAQHDARPFSTAAATLEGSTAAYGTTLLDQLNLIIKNAEQVRTGGSFVNIGEIAAKKANFPCNLKMSIDSYLLHPVSLK